MKYLLLFFILPYLLPAQSRKDVSVSVAYLATFKDRHSQTKELQEYFNLLIKNDKSIFQTYNERELDTLKSNNRNTSEMRSKYFSFNKFAVLFENKSDLKFFEQIGNEEYQYAEKMQLEWEFHDDTMVIKDYKCKKATTYYAGRQWVAWYAPSIPIDAGPYKFRGLPGLILKMSDSTGSYDFSLYGLRERDIDEIYKYYHYKPEKQRILLERKEFNAFKQGYEGLTLNEKLNYGSSENTIKVVKVDSDNSPLIRNTSASMGSSDINLIEIDHLKN